MDGERDAVGNADLAHQAADVTLYSALVNAEHGEDLPVVAAIAQQLQDLSLALRKARRGRLVACVQQPREHLARRPDGTIAHRLNCEADLALLCGRGEIALYACANHPLNMFG